MTKKIKAIATNIANSLFFVEKYVLRTFFQPPKIFDNHSQKLLNQLEGTSYSADGLIWSGS